MTADRFQKGFGAYNARKLSPRGDVHHYTYQRIHVIKELAIYAGEIRDFVTLCRN
jgi:hypothetical protein